MMPAQLNFDGVSADPIIRGSTFDVTLTYRDSAGAAIDLTGYTADMVVKLESGDLTLSTANGKIVLGGAAGTIRLLLSATETAALTLSLGTSWPKLERAQYILRLIQGSAYSPILVGFMDAQDYSA